jgi:hypothetical protein
MPIVVAAIVGSAVATTAPAQTPPPFRPGLGDLMNMLVQPRHLKLGLAGRERNWAYAGFAAHELEESFETVAHVMPQWRNLDLAKMIESGVKDPLEAVEKAIKARDAAGFDRSFRDLTEACNACHRAADMGMIVIRVPDSNPFPNQDFRPRKP